MDEVKPINVSNKDKEFVETKQTPKDDILDEIQAGSYCVGTVGEEEESDTDDSFEDGRLLTGQKYENPKDVDKFIDTSKGELIDKGKLSEFDVIKAIAKQTGIEIKKPNSGCKHCYGRGWIGKDYITKAPIPCNCIYPPKTHAQKIVEATTNGKKEMPKMNRKTIKQLRKLIKTEKKMVKKQKMQEENRLQKLEG